MPANAYLIGRGEHTHIANHLTVILDLFNDLLIGLLLKR